MPKMKIPPYPDSQNGMTIDECLPFMCGADPMNQGKIMACAAAGYSGNFGCGRDVCAPWCPAHQAAAPQSPSVAPVVSTPPRIQASSPVTRPSSTPVVTTPPRITTNNLAAPLPDISQALQPIFIPVPCSAWDEFNQSIMDHPVAAAGILALGFFLLWKAKK